MGTAGRPATLAGTSPAGAQPVARHRWADGAGGTAPGGTEPVARRVGGWQRRPRPGRRSWAGTTPGGNCTGPVRGRRVRPRRHPGRVGTRWIGARRIRPGRVGPGRIGAGRAARRAAARRRIGARRVRARRIHARRVETGRQRARRRPARLDHRCRRSDDGRAVRRRGVDRQRVTDPAVAVPVALGRRLGRVPVPTGWVLTHGVTFTTTVSAHCIVQTLPIRPVPQ